jgi:hypothetical protein
MPQPLSRVPQDIRQHFFFTLLYGKTLKVKLVCCHRGS